MKYSHNYTKLGDRFYTTIRRYNQRHKKGDIVTEKYPSGKHEAIILNIEREALANIDIEFLSDDTDCLVRKDIYDLFQSFYKKTIDFYNERFYIYYMERIF